MNSLSLSRVLGPSSRMVFTFTHMVEAVRQRALAARIIDANTFDQGIRDLYRVADTGGVFCYTFFKGVGVNRGG